MPSGAETLRDADTACGEHVAFDIGSAGLSVCFDDPGLRPVVRSVFPLVGSDSSPDGTRVCIRRWEGGYRLHSPTGEVVEVTGDEQDLLSALEDAIVSHMWSVQSEILHLHAAGVVGSGGAALALGPSGAGKSSVALAWTIAGLPILGDDVVGIDGAGQVVAFPRHIKVHRDRLVAVGVAPEGTPGYADDHDELWVDPVVTGAGFASAPAPLRTAALLRHEPGLHGVRIRALDPPELLLICLRSQVGPERAPGPVVDRLTTALAEVEGIGLRYGDSLEAAAWLATRVGAP